MKRNKRKARFGQKWFDRYAHFTSQINGGKIETWGGDEFGRVVLWPTPCLACVADLDAWPISR